MKLVLALAALLSVVQPALADSGYDVVSNQIQSRARIAQMEQSRRELQKQIDNLNDEMGRLNRAEEMNGGQLVELLSNVRQIGRCSMDVQSNDQMTTITVQNRKGELETITIARDRMKHADVKSESRLDGRNVIATVLGQNLRDTNNNETKVLLTYGQNGQLQEMQLKTDRKGSDFEAKDCRP